MTPEELAACLVAKETFEAVDWTERPRVAEYFFAAGLSHARAESAKEIADLKVKHLKEWNEENGLRMDALVEVAQLKAKVEGMRNAIQMAIDEGQYPQGSGVLRLLKAAIAQEKPNDR